MSSNRVAHRAQKLHRHPVEAYQTSFIRVCVVHHIALFLGPSYTHTVVPNSLDVIHLVGIRMLKMCEK